MQGPAVGRIVSIEYLLIEKTSQRSIELDWPLQYREMTGLLNYVELPTITCVRAVMRPNDASGITFHRVMLSLPGHELRRPDHLLLGPTRAAVVEPLG